jgi:hypothetical protein
MKIDDENIRRRTLDEKTVSVTVAAFVSGAVLGANRHYLNFGPLRQMPEAKGLLFLSAVSA